MKVLINFVERIVNNNAIENNNIVPVTSLFNNIFSVTNVFKIIPWVKYIYKVFWPSLVRIDSFFGTILKNVVVTIRLNK